MLVIRFGLSYGLNIMPTIRLRFFIGLNIMPEIRLRFSRGLNIIPAIRLGFLRGLDILPAIRFGLSWGLDFMSAFLGTLFSRQKNMSAIRFMFFSFKRNFFVSLHSILTKTNRKNGSIVLGLSRRLRTYHLEGLSFREYLAINDIVQLYPQTLDDILIRHQQMAASITSELKVLPLSHPMYLLSAKHFPPPAIN